jgi:hypothetical protein
VSPTAPVAHRLVLGRLDCLYFFHVHVDHSFEVVTQPDLYYRLLICTMGNRLNVTGV